MVCRDCFRGTIHDHAEPKGTFQDLYGYSTYVSLPPDNPNPKSTIIFYCDAFGLNLPNNKILADYYAAETGFRVLTPDIIPGGGVSERVMHGMNDLTRNIPSWWSLANPMLYINKIWSAVVVLPVMVPFMIRSGAPGAYPELLRYARETRAGLPAGGKLGAAGFCWGGYPATKLCGEAATEGGTTPLLDASFAAHPSFLNAPDDVVNSLSKFNTPYFCAVAEYDFLFDKSVAEKCEVALREKMGSQQGNYEFFIHKGAHHGFTVRASPDEGSVGKEGYELAARQACDWFSKYLK
jgi:dienelactone hydrolase